jgi:uncharacterized membrane protein
METITYLFSYVCGQVRSFYVDGIALPVDQRCLGLYLGAFLTALWLAGSGVWRRGLPGPGVLLVHIALLGAALLGGLHVIDPGPQWRLLFGLWTGHVVIFWLVGASMQLCSRGRSDPRLPLPWGASDRLQALVAPAALAGIAALFPLVLPPGWYFWAATAILGAAVLFTAIPVALVVAVAPARRRDTEIPSAFGSID